MTHTDIKQTRLDAGLTQLQASKLVYSSQKNWSDWESGNHKMHPAIYELFLIKLGYNTRH